MRERPSKAVAAIAMWESTSKRIRKDTWGWLQNHITAWVLAFIVPGAGTVVATLFIPGTMNIRLAALLGFVGGVAGLALLIGGTYGLQSILVLRKQRDEARKLYEPIKELANIKAGDTIKDKNINVSLMFQQLKTDRLANLTFDHCIFRGPCIIGFEGNNKFYASNFGGKFVDRLIKCEQGKRYFGIAVFLHCEFNFCEFVDTSFLMPEGEIKLFLSKVVQA
jgi:hypothetical protein